MGNLTLTGKGRRWLQKGHLWVYVDDVADGKGEPGELLPVAAPDGTSLGWGMFSTSSRIAVRMVTREADQPKRSFWEERIRRAVSRRAERGELDQSGACRLLAGDSEGVPGLIVDRYGSVLVLQCGTQSADRMRDFLLEILLEALPFEPSAIVDRSDTSVRRLESLETRVEVVSGSTPGPIDVREGELVYQVDVFEGHKTGAYLDQRNNRLQAAAGCEGKQVLDAFAYDGLFGLQAALAGAERVVFLEQNKRACERLEAAAARNGLTERVEVVRTNAMHALRNRAADGERHDVVIVDPPAFARNKKELEGAERGYVELNRRALEMLSPEGRLVSASCSHAVVAEKFVGYLGSAARLAARDLWIEDLRGASPDHPWLVSLPETRYLKCVFGRVGS